jgi:hypothetical protein
MDVHAVENPKTEAANDRTEAASEVPTPIGRFENA